MNKIITIFAILLVSPCISVLQAQEAVVSSGGNAIGSNGTASWSVGQIAFTSIDNSNGSVYQGVQQPFEFFTVGINDNNEVTLSMMAYPNPTSDFIILNTGTDKSKTLSYLLYNFNGKLLADQKLNGIQTTIPMWNNSPGLYFLKVSDNGTELKTFKIIKN